MTVCCLTGTTRPYSWGSKVEEAEGEGEPEGLGPRRVSSRLMLVWVEDGNGCSSEAMRSPERVSESVPFGTLAETAL